MADVRDLDETRRLLYMALLARRTKKYNLAGTLVNALANHVGCGEKTDVIEDRVIACIEGDATIFDDTDAWIREQIQTCTELIAQL